MSRLETIGRERGAFFRGDELMKTHFPEPRWAIPGLIPEGLTLLAGAPKLGKSWLALGISIDVSNGTPVLGGVDVEAGQVLYAALEDTPRRIKNRLLTMTDSEDGPPSLTVITEISKMPDAVVLLNEYLDEHPDTRLVIVDVLGKIRPMTAMGRDRYEADYEVIGALKALADRHRVAVVAVTHTRKMGDEDVFSTVSGSTGLTGAADATMVLHRKRGEEGATLNITGRDVLEAEYALTFIPETGRWILAGDSLADASAAATQRKVSSGLGDASTAVLEFIAANPEGVTPKQVAEHLGWEDTKARTYLKRLFDAERIARPSRGTYVSINNSVTTVTSVTIDQEGDGDSYTNNSSYSASQGTPEPSATSLCGVCNEAMLATEPGQTTHPTCEALW